MAKEVLVRAEEGGVIRRKGAGAGLGLNDGLYCTLTKCSGNQLPEGNHFVLVVAVGCSNYPGIDFSDARRNRWFA